MNKYGKFYSKYYDLIYKQKNYISETDYILKLIKKYFKNKKPSILELGTGTGGHAKIIAKKKYQIDGLEKSKLMIKNFNINNKKIKVYNQDMRYFSLKKKYDVVIALFCVVNYLTSLKDFDKMISRVKKHLNYNGIMIFDFWFSPAVNYLKPKKTFFKYNKDDIKIFRKCTPILKQNKVIDILYNFDITDKCRKFNFKEKHTVRHYSIYELKKLFKKYNLELVYKGEMITNLKPSKKTWKICVVFKNALND